MPRKSLSDELKAAIAELPHKAKNKLLNRLIAKDEVLTEQLTFELLENKSTTEFRRNNLAETIRETISKAKNSTPKQMYWHVRKLSAQITRHVRVTKDKYGDIELTLILVSACLENYQIPLETAWSKPAHKLREYLVKKIIRVQKLSLKIHPDYLIDFEEHLMKIGKIVSMSQKFISISEQLGLPIEQIQKGSFG